MARKERLAKTTASDNTPIEVTDGITDYLYQQYNKGRIERQTVLELADMLDIPRKVSTEVSLKVSVNLAVPFDATVQDVVNSLKLTVESNAFPVQFVTWNELD